MEEPRPVCLVRGQERQELRTPGSDHEGRVGATGTPAPPTLYLSPWRKGVIAGPTMPMQDKQKDDQQAQPSMMLRGPDKLTYSCNQMAGTLFEAPEDGSTSLILTAYILQQFGAAKAPMRARSYEVSASP